MNARSNRIVRIFLRHSLPLIIVVLLLGGGSTLMVRNFIRKNSVSQATQKLLSVQSFYDVILDEMDSLNLMFSTNPEMMARMMQILSEEQEVDLDNYREIRLIRSFISAPANARPYIHNIYVYLENAQDLVLTADMAFIPLLQLEDQSWHETYRSLPPASQSFSERVTLKRGKTTEQTIIRILRPIISQTRQKIGVIVLDIKEPFLAASYQFQDGELFEIHNREGDLLLSNHTQESVFTRTNLELFSIESSKYGWQYTLGFYKPQLYALSTTIGYYTLGLTLLALILGLILTHRTNLREHNFLTNVLNQLAQVTESNLSEESPEQYRNIFDYLNHHVIRTFLEQDYLRWQKEAMEYRALQMQINPHFLFNTLDTINWKAIKLTDGENDVSHMIQLLSKLLKYSLQVDDVTGVPLETEFSRTRQYITLQEIRFPGQFTYREQIDPALATARVPSLLLQPILENAFNHGFVEGRVLAITVTAQEERGRLVITIENDGKPLDEKRLAELNNEKVDVLKRETSLGLMNIKKRLSLFSAEAESVITFTSGSERGFAAVVNLPLRWQ